MLTAQILPGAPGSSSYEAWTGSLSPSPPRSPRVLLLGSEGGGKLREPLRTCEPLTPLHPAPELESCRGAGLTDLLRVRLVLVGRGFCPNSVSLPYRSRGSGELPVRALPAAPLTGRALAGEEMTRQKGPGAVEMEAAAAAGAGRPGLPGTRRGWGKGAILPGTRGGRPQRPRTAWARTRSLLSLFTPGAPDESGRGQLSPRPQVPRQFPGVLHPSLPVTDKAQRRPAYPGSQNGCTAVLGVTPKVPASRRSQWPRASPGFGPGGWGLSRRTRGRLPKHLHPSRVPRLKP